MPVDAVRIDRRFVAELGDTPGSSTLAQMILQMTAGLEVTSVFNPDACITAGIGR